MARRRWLAAATALGATALMSALVRAQAYPARPITLVVSFEPGGSTDLSARVVATELSRLLGQQVVVDNRAGAGGRIGTKSVALAKSDGYTLLWGSGSTLTAAPALFADQGHVATLVPVSLGATQPFVFVTTPATGARTVTDFAALTRRNSGALNFASAGVGSSNHLLGEIFMAATGAQLTHVPYKGSASAKEAMLKGDAQLMDEAVSPLLPQIRSGQGSGFFGLMCRVYGFTGMSGPLPVLGTPSRSSAHDCTASILTGLSRCGVDDDHGPRDRALGYFPGRAVRGLAEDFTFRAEVRRLNQQAHRRGDGWRRQPCLARQRR